MERIRQTIVDLPSAANAQRQLVDKFVADDPAASIVALNERAKELVRQTQALERMATQVHQRATLRQLAAALEQPDDQVDLVLAALLVARLDNAELDVAAYQGEVTRLAGDVKRSLEPNATPRAKLAALDRYLFAENGFHGSRGDYYNRSNSYLNEVLDDREGLPITLSLLYMELARRLGVKVEGVALPGHFIVRSVLPDEPPQLIDVYEGAKRLSREQAADKALRLADAPLADEQLQPVKKRAIIERMLHNLLGVANREHDTAAMLRYTDSILNISPASAQDRLMRAVLLYGAGRPGEAKQDTAWLLENEPPEIDLDKVRELHGVLERAESNAD
jgi:serine protease Do